MFNIIDYFSKKCPICASKHFSPERLIKCMDSMKERNKDINVMDLAIKYYANQGSISMSLDLIKIFLVIPVIGVTIALMIMGQFSWVQFFVMMGLIYFLAKFSHTRLPKKGAKNV